jgi:dTDP-glucose pyrophosphorylase
MLNIVLPIAGRGSRFAEAGYALPKPLIPVYGVPMIEVVVNNVRPSCAHRFTFVALQEHLDHTDMKPTLQRIAPGCNIVPVTQVTEGAACTLLLARDVINSDDALMTVNSDQYVDVGIDDYLATMDREKADGLIMTFWSDHPKWSYCRMRADGTVSEVVEKQVVSNEATVGIYNWRRGKDFVWSAEEMIRRNLRVNGEFYAAPSYNLMIERGQKLVVHNIGKEYEQMHGLGIPNDLDRFHALPGRRELIAGSGKR